MSAAQLKERFDKAVKAKKIVERDLNTSKTLYTAKEEEATALLEEAGISLPKGRAAKDVREALKALAKQYDEEVTTMEAEIDELLDSYEKVVEDDSK